MSPGWWRGDAVARRASPGKPLQPRGDQGTGRDALSCIPTAPPKGGGKGSGAMHIMGEGGRAVTKLWASRWPVRKDSSIQTVGTGGAGPSLAAAPSRALDQRQNLAHRRAAALGHHDPLQGPAGRSFHLDGCFAVIHGDERLAFGHAVARRFEPLGDEAINHAHAKLWQANLYD